MPDPDTSDEQFLAAFARGDRSALDELARRYEVSLLGLARGLLGGPSALACDAVQETWLRVIRFARTFDARSSFKTWLYRIAINQCRNLRQVSPAAQSSSPLEALPSAEPSPDKAVEAAENNRVLQDAVEQLAPEKRLIVLLCYHRGMTHQQAADILEVPIGTLKSRLHAALEELRARLSSEATS